MKVRALTPQQRLQRRHDLQLAAATLRRQIGADLARLEPAADRVLIWVDTALWLRRHWPAISRGPRQVALLLAAAGGVVGAGGIGAFALRHWRWLRNAIVAWRVWRGARR